MLKRILLFVGLAVLILAAIVVARTLMLDYEKMPVEPVAYEDVPLEQALERLSEAIQYRTISHQDPEDLEREEFEGFIAFLEEAYPNLHEALDRERIGDYSLLYRWEGSDPDLRPAMLIGHYDVVPVEEGTEDQWSYPPFSGEIAEGFVWGRGSIDDKSGVLSSLEAVEYLLETGYGPERTIYLGLHHDEEVGGFEGAGVMADTLRVRGIELEYLLDEGLPVAEEVLPGIESPLAMVGIAEKGYLSLELSVTRDGGHSSMPPRETTIHTLAGALEALRQNPMPGRFADLIQNAFAPISPELPFAYRTVLANLWLFRPVLEARLSDIPHTDAALRTTIAPTMFNAGIKENVLPATARAVVNFRIHPNDSVDSVIEHVEYTINNSEIELHKMDRAREPSVVSETQSPSYQQLQRSIKEIFPDVPVAPSLFIAATDSRHYHGLTRNIYRFRPIRARPDDRPRIHGTDERIGTENFAEMIQFKIRLIENTTS